MADAEQDGYSRISGTLDDLLRHFVLVVEAGLMEDIEVVGIMTTSWTWFAGGRTRFVARQWT